MPEIKQYLIFLYDRLAHIKCIHVISSTSNYAFCGYYSVSLSKKLDFIALIRGFSICERSLQTNSAPYNIRSMTDTEPEVFFLSGCRLGILYGPQLQLHIGLGLLSNANLIMKQLCLGAAGKGTCFMYSEWFDVQLCTFVLVFPDSI